MVLLVMLFLEKDSIFELNVLISKEKFVNSGRQTEPIFLLLEELESRLLQNFRHDTGHFFQLNVEHSLEILAHVFVQFDNDFITDDIENLEEPAKSEGILGVFEKLHVFQDRMVNLFLLKLFFVLHLLFCCHGGIVQKISIQE